MKTSLCTMLAGAGCAMILTTSAQAAYTGLYIEHSDSYFSNHPNTTVRDAWNAGPVNQYDIFRLYAVFTSNTDADRVNAVAGTPQSPLQINSINGSFYNYTEDDAHGTVHFHLPSFNPPERAWDTYVTIGNAVNGGATLLTPGFDVETDNLMYHSTAISATNVAWFVTPFDVQGRAVVSAPGQANAPAGQYRVLLAQFTMSQGGYFLGNFLVNVNGVNFLNQSLLIPSPGGFALLAMAGFAAPRRRRCC